MKLIFSTHNQNKLKEVRSLIPANIQLMSLDELNFKNEIEETETTIEGNALLKARTIYKHTGINCFSDDSGLLVDDLNGAPGVYSARFAGEQKNDQDNIDKLLNELRNSKNRAAHFKTVMALVLEGKEYVFEGIIHGKITTEKQGSNGFGYDPVFMPEGYNQTFAQMDPETKNSISHRGIALKKLVDFLVTSSVLRTPPSKEE
ncbi:MAG: Nucleoside-triphosphatase rdgB [Bacteroidetes bacterium]|jgi:XTP/dITP diphosphohydrolase|nr:Nucleoside-triphosphatase rdgB [Bacteroidota bacterium]MDF2452252.1 Nucleoside-triphosphatase rdgB [Bacteroidota bacterium]